MAVFRRGYRSFDGALTPRRWRFLVLPKYSALELVQSRPVMLFLLVCLMPFVAESALVYLVHNPVALAALGLAGGLPPVETNARFFLGCLRTQGFLAFVLAAWVGPGLVAPDLANGALPLYLSRPLSRAEYVAGKMSVLFVILSLVTWVPVLMLFLQTGALVGGWLQAQQRIGYAIVAGSLLWVAVLALIALALSAWVRRRVAATLLMIALYFAGTAFGEMWRGVLGNPWGRLLNLNYLIGLVWHDLFAVPRPRRLAGVGIDRLTGDIPVWAAWTALLVVCATCLWLLDRRIRGREVVR